MGEGHKGTLFYVCNFSINLKSNFIKKIGITKNKHKIYHIGLVKKFIWVFQPSIT